MDKFSNIIEINPKLDDPTTVSGRAPMSSGDFPGDCPQAAFDPHLMIKNWPAVWMRIVRTCCRNVLDVQVTFGVSERTARDWWEGKLGARGPYVWMAIVRDPRAIEIMREAA